MTAIPDSSAPQASVVLVVDDSPVDRRLAGGILEKSHYQAAYAGNGVEALAALEHQLPSVVLTDLQMPEMDGLELVEAIRNKYPLVPVILMTAHGSETIAIQALQRGAASYVPKKDLATDLLESARTGRDRGQGRPAPAAPADLPDPRGHALRPGERSRPAAGPGRSRSG